MNRISIIVIVIATFLCGGLIVLLIMLRSKHSKEKTSLLNYKVSVDVLTGQYLTDWFRANQELNTDGVKMVVSYASDDILKSFGVDNSNEDISNRDIVQMFFNETTNQSLKLRLITYRQIETNLEAELEAQDGFMVVTE